MISEEDREHLEGVFDGAEQWGDEERLLREVFASLNAGSCRVAGRVDGEWITHGWVKKAILFSLLRRSRL